MICSFYSKEEEKIFNGQLSTKLPLTMQNVARRKLRLIAASICINDLVVPPSNHFEQLKGKLGKDFKYSIRINDQYRIIFNFTSKGAENVRITDYH